MASKTYIAIAPQDVTAAPDLSRRFLRLPHPRTGGLVVPAGVDLHRLQRVTGAPTLYLPTGPDGSGTDPSENAAQQQILEVQRVQPPKERSWFIEDSVVGDGSLLLFTPIDPLFLLIPLLASLLSPSARSASSALNGDAKTVSKDLENPWLGINSDAADTQAEAGPSKLRYRPMEDLVSDAACSRGLRVAPMFEKETRPSGAGQKKEEVERVDERNEQEQANEDVIRLCGLSGMRDQLEQLCESTTIAGETYLRPSTRAVMARLKRKVEHLAQEDTMRRFKSLRKGLAREGLGDDDDEEVLADEGADADAKRRAGVEVPSQAGGEAGQEASMPPEGKSAAAPPTPPKSPERLALEHQARLKLACELVGQYLPPAVSSALVQHFDFSALTAHHDHLASLAFASHGSGMADAEAAEDGPGQKKAAGEKPGVKRKGSGGGGRGVEALKKVNTTKMRKLTTFFVKK